MEEEQCPCDDCDATCDYWVTEIIANGVEFIERKAGGGSASAGDKGGFESFGQAEDLSNIPF